jgi:hypothetical protein
MTFLAAKYISIAGAVVVFGFVWFLAKFLDQPSDVRWYQAGVALLCLLSILNGIENWRVGLSPIKPTTWLPTFRRFRQGDSDVRRRIVLLVGSSATISLWLAVGAGITQWDLRKIAAVCLTALAWPVAYMLRPFVSRRHC